MSQIKNQSISYGIIGLLVGTLIGIFTASSAVNNNISGMMRMMGMRSNLQGNSLMGNVDNLDSHFIEQMIPHHEDAVTMAKLAQTKSKQPEIKNLAEAIIKDQSQEINQMKERYKAWYGKDVPQDQEVMGMHGMQERQGMHMGMMGDETDMTQLENAEDFDKVFIEEMIPHHQMAVMMATMLKNGTQREEMKQLAQNIIEAQTREINDMRSWYSTWYK